LKILFCKKKKIFHAFHKFFIRLDFKKEIEAEIKKTINRDINLNCLKDVAFVLYDLLKLKPNDCNQNSLKAKHRSTCKETLMYLAKQHILPNMIILWRKIDHTLSHSINPISEVN